MQCDTEACSQNGTIKLFVQTTISRRGDIGLPKHSQSLNKKVCGRPLTAIQIVCDYKYTSNCIILVLLHKE